MKQKVSGKGVLKILRFLLYKNSIRNNEENVEFSYFFHFLMNEYVYFIVRYLKIWVEILISVHNIVERLIHTLCNTYSYYGK